MSSLSDGQTFFDPFNIYSNNNCVLMNFVNCGSKSPLNLFVHLEGLFCVLSLRKS